MSKPMSRRLRFALPFVLLAASMPPPAQAQSGVPDLETEIRQRAAAIESKLIAWRRDIHEHPELGEQETRTSALVAAHLTSLGLDVKTGVGNTGVVGLLNGAKLWRQARAPSPARSWRCAPTWTRCR